MGVILSPGGSGNRQPANPPVPASGQSQPVQDSSTNAAIPSTIHFPKCKSTSPESSRGEPEVPTGGSNPPDSNHV